MIIKNFKMNKQRIFKMKFITYNLIKINKIYKIHQYSQINNQILKIKQILIIIKIYWKN